MEANYTQTFNGPQFTGVSVMMRKAVWHGWSFKYHIMPTSMV